MKGIEITAKRDGHRRAGMAHPATLTPTLSRRRERESTLSKRTDP